MDNQTKPLTDDEIEMIIRSSHAVCRLSGLRADCIKIGHPPNQEPLPANIVLTIIHHNDELTFDVLDKLSKHFGTRDLSVSCDLGTESKRRHRNQITIKLPPTKIPTRT